MDLGEQAIEVDAVKFPLEGLDDPLVMILEVQQAGFCLGEVGAVVGSEYFALNHREVDLDLVVQAI